MTTVLDEEAWSIFQERPDDIEDEPLAIMGRILELEVAARVNALTAVRAVGRRRLEEREAEVIATDRAKILYDITNKYSPDLPTLARLMPAAISAALFAYDEPWEETVTVKHEGGWRLTGSNVRALVNAIEKLGPAEKEALYPHLHNNPEKKVKFEVSD